MFFLKIIQISNGSGGVSLLIEQLFALEMLVEFYDCRVEYLDFCMRWLMFSKGGSAATSEL
jgi:hypothetical protein